MNNNDAKKKLRELRKKANMTQQEMARMIGIKRTTYRNLESGTTKIINETAIRVANALKKPIEAIITDYDFSGPSPALLMERNKEFEKEIVTLSKELSETRDKLSRTLKECGNAKRELARTKEALSREMMSYDDLREINRLQRELLEKERKHRETHD